MRMKDFKKLIIFLIVLVVVTLGTILFLYLKDIISQKDISKLKKSTITYLGRDEEDNFVYIGNDGKTYVFNGYTSMQDFDYETVNARKDGLEGVINKNNKVIVPFGKYYDISDERFCGSYIVQSEDGKYGLISYNGKVILDTVYDSITTFGKDVPVYKIAYEGLYGISTNKEIIYETQNEGVSAEFGTRLYSDSDRGLVKIIDGETEIIFDSYSGKQLYAGKGYEVEYNTVKDTENNRYILIDKKGNEKLKVDYISGEESIDIKFDKYLVIESKAGYYEIFNKDFVKIFETGRKPIFFKTYKDETYIINNVENGVDIYKEDKYYKSINGYEYANDNMVEYGCMFGLKNIQTGKVDLFDFELNKLKEDVLLDKIYPKYVLLVNAESKKVAYTNTKQEIELGNEISIHTLNTNSAFNDYIVVSKSNNDIFEILDLKGNSVIKNIEKVEVLLDNYIIITDKVKGDMYLFSINDNKEIFRFEKDKFDSAYQKVQAIKLKTGYFNYKGEQIAKIEE